MPTYYAVCNVNGPISRGIDADSIEDAVAKFEEALESGEARRWIDDARCDAEDDLDIENAVQMDERTFGNVLQRHGYVPIRDLASQDNVQAGVVRHEQDGWMLWGPAQ